MNFDPTNSALIGIQITENTDETIEISISDNDPGISEEHLPKLFNESLQPTATNAHGLLLKNWNTYEKPAHATQ